MKLLAYILGLCCLTGANGCIADAIILGSNTAQFDTTGAHVERVKVDGRSVECWVARSPAARSGEPQAFLMFFVGRRTRADHWVRAVADAQGDWPVEVWGMNYPGTGGTEGSNRLLETAPDALGAYDALRQVAGRRPIWIEATSFGTSVALAVAKNRPVAGLILQKPPALRQLIVGEYGWWNLWLLALPVSWQIPADLDAIENARGCTAPAVFVIAGEDEVTPPKYSRMVFDAYAGPKRLVMMPGAHHHDRPTGQAAEEIDRAKAWLRGTVSQPHALAR